MQVNQINNNQTCFQAVNEAYLKTAKGIVKEISEKGSTNNRDLIKFVQHIQMNAAEKKIPRIDLFDTLSAIRKLKISVDTQLYIANEQIKLAKQIISERYPEIKL